MHGPIEAARTLRNKHDLKPEQISSVRLRVDQATDRVCNIAAPRTGLEAKFSLRLAVAMALAGVPTEALDSYSEATAADPRLIALRDQVEMEFQSGWPHTLAEVELELMDGKRVTHRHDSGVPAEDVAAQGGRIEAKFSALVAPLLGARAEQIIGAVNGLDTLPDIRGVMELCAG